MIRTENINSKRTRKFEQNSRFIRRHQQNDDYTDLCLPFGTKKRLNDKIFLKDVIFVVLEIFYKLDLISLVVCLDVSRKYFMYFTRLDKFSFSYSTFGFFV